MRDHRRVQEGRHRRPQHDARGKPRRHPPTRKTKVRARDVVIAGACRTTRERNRVDASRYVRYDGSVWNDSRYGRRKMGIGSPSTGDLMRRHRSHRRVARLLLLLVHVWLLWSLGWYYGYSGPSWRVSSGNGEITWQFGMMRFPASGGERYGPFSNIEPGFGALLRIPKVYFGPCCATIRVPFWVPYLGTLAIVSLLYWISRRRPAGQCQECSYDLTGNTSGVCPECGTTTASSDGRTDKAD